jgi:hypothetical protein
MDRRGYVRRRAGSIVDAVEPQIRQLLAVWPDMPATVIAERIGWTRSLTVLNTPAVVRDLAVLRCWTRTATAVIIAGCVDS